MTAGEVQAELGADLAYNTVLTVLTRLHAKGALQRSPQGRAFAYRLAGAGGADARASATARRMRMLLDADENPASVLVRFVGSLDEETEGLLRALLNENEPGHGDKP